MWLLFSIAVALPAINIKGIVTDPEGKPLNDAVINDQYHMTRSSSDGRFNFTTSEDSVFVSKLGYSKQGFAARKIPGTIILNISPIELAPITVIEKYSTDFSASADMHTLRINPERSYSSTTEMLSSVSGVFSNDIPLKGEQQTIALLGNLSRHTLILLDGVPLNPQGEAFDLSRINPESIDKIEIIKNNASVYGGASAIGGIVHLHSKKSAQTGQNAFGYVSEYGSFGYHKRSLSMENAGSDFHYVINLANYSTANDFKYTMPQWWTANADSSLKRTNNAKEQIAFSAGMSTKIREVQLSYNTDYDQFRRELPGPVNFLQIYQHAFLSGMSLRNNLQLGWGGDRLRWKTIAWLNRDNTFYDNTRAELPVFQSQYRQGMDTGGIRNTLSATKSIWEINLAQDYLRTSYENRNLLHPLASISKTIDQQGLAAKLGANWEFDAFAHQCSGALRNDRAFGDQFYTWRAEYAVKYSGLIDVNAGATWGTSFSLPSFYDLYWKGDAQAVGNPDLLPEKAQGQQLWTELLYGRQRFKLALHHNSIRDLIQWRQVYLFGTNWKPFNVGKADIQNLEIELDLQPQSWVKIASTAVLTSAKDVSSAAASPNLMYTPQLKWAVRGDFTARNAGLWLRYSYTGKQWVTPDNLIAPLPEFALTDAGISYSFERSKLKLVQYFDVYNVLNRRYQIYQYVPQPGVNWTLGIRLAAKI
jgi:outer membrane cobalamin receptor